MDKQDYFSVTFFRCFYKVQDVDSECKVNIFCWGYELTHQGGY